MRLLVAVAIFSLGVLPVCADPNSSANQPVPNNGADFTRPPSSFDFRYQYQDKPNDVGQDTFTLRLNSPFDLGNGWEFATRFDLPFVCSDAKGSGNPNGAEQFGVGNVLLQAAIIDQISKRWAAGLGVRATLPTVTHAELGSDNVQLGPIGAVRSFLPEISRGSYAMLVARYQYNFGGKSDTIYWSPTVSFALPHDWFFILYPSQDIAVNLQDNGKWFVPLDVSVGKSLSQTQVVSLELSQALIKQYTSYNFKLEARWSIYF